MVLTIDAVGDELANWFHANYRLQTVNEMVANLSVLNLKEVIEHFKQFAGKSSSKCFVDNSLNFL